MEIQKGGCLCGALRYQVSAQPVRVSFCHCRFCQRATGGPYIVEPIFNSDDVTLTSGRAKTYDQRSEGSGKIIQLHFCETCGTRLFYTFERFPGLTGVLAGSFDDPNWFSYDAETAKHIFLDDARDDTVVPAGLPTFQQHATTRDGTPCEATVFDMPHAIRPR